MFPSVSFQVSVYMPSLKVVRNVVDRMKNLSNFLVGRHFVLFRLCGLKSGRPLWCHECFVAVVVVASPSGPLLHCVLETPPKSRPTTLPANCAA